MKTFKILIPTILLIATTPVMAGIFDKIGDFIDTKLLQQQDKNLPIDTITISDYEYTKSEWGKYFVEGTGPSAVDFKGRIYNNSSTVTVAQVNIKFTILECNSSGENCTTIDEDTTKISRDIPPQQARYFDDIIFYKARRNKNIYYRFTVTSVKAK
jgi:hypothetical protein